MIEAFEVRERVLRAIASRRRILYSTSLPAHGKATVAVLSEPLSGQSISEGYLRRLFASADFGLDEMNEQITVEDLDVKITPVKTGFGGKGLVAFVSLALVDGSGNSLPLHVMFSDQSAAISITTA